MKPRKNPIHGVPPLKTPTVGKSTPKTNKGAISSQESKLGGHKKNAGGGKAKGASLDVSGPGSNGMA